MFDKRIRQKICSTGRCDTSAHRCYIFISCWTVEPGPVYRLWGCRWLWVHPFILFSTVLFIRVSNILHRTGYLSHEYNW